MRILTIGFTKTTARSFFDALKRTNVKRMIDVRLRNDSQLAGFAKQTDLRYFLHELANITYAHEPLLAPTPELLDSYKKQKGSWDVYQSRFLALLAEREVERKLIPEMFADACLLCSEHEPHHCHRRLVAEYLREKWGNIEIQHLLPKGETCAR